MKGKFNILFCTLLTMFVLAACSEKDDELVFSVDKTELTLGAEGGTENIVVKSSAEWVAVASEPWLMVSPANGIGTTECEIVVDSTLLNGMRTATVRFANQTHTPLVIKVSQTGFDKMIRVEDPEIEIEASAAIDKRYLETSVTTNVPFKLEVQYEGGETQWLTPQVNEVELDRGARPRTTKVRIDWRMNFVPEKRIAKVNFIPTNAEDVIKEPATLTITQKAALQIEDNRAGDSLALLVIHERLNMMSNRWNTGELLNNWPGVTVWEKTDKDLPCEEAIGRVRSVSYSMFKTSESIPQEIRYLKYLESFFVGSNINTMLLSIDLGSEICELQHLKRLELFAYGFVSLPEDFVKLGKTLEYLDLSANNFTTIPEVLNKENFPKLKSLVMTGNRRWTTSDLRKASTYTDGLGMFFNETHKNTLRKLFMWDTLEELRLSFNYIEGSIPDFKVGEDGVEAYTQADVEAFGGDTIQYVVDNQIPKILPNMKMLALNLNFFTGKLPDWILYHPYFMEWFPEILMFNQQEKAVNSEGKAVGFDNTPKSFEYYYQAFPLYREKYEFVEEIED